MQKLINLKKKTQVKDRLRYVTNTTPVKLHIFNWHFFDVVTPQPSKFIDVLKKYYYTLYYQLQQYQIEVVCI